MGCVFSDSYKPTGTYDSPFLGNFKIGDWEQKLLQSPGYGTAISLRTRPTSMFDGIILPEFYIGTTKKFLGELKALLTTDLSTTGKIDFSKEVSSPHFRGFPYVDKIGVQRVMKFSMYIIYFNSKLQKWGARFMFVEDINPPEIPEPMVDPRYRLPLKFKFFISYDHMISSRFMTKARAQQLMGTGAPQIRVRVDEILRDAQSKAEAILKAKKTLDEQTSRKQDGGSYIVGAGAGAGASVGEGFSDKPKLDTLTSLSVSCIHHELASPITVEDISVAPTTKEPDLVVSSEYTYIETVNESQHQSPLVEHGAVEADESIQEVSEAVPPVEPESEVSVGSTEAVPLVEHGAVEAGESIQEVSEATPPVELEREVSVGFAGELPLENTPIQINLDLEEGVMLMADVDSGVEGSIQNATNGEEHENEDTDNAIQVSLAFEEGVTLTVATNSDVEEVIQITMNSEESASDGTGGHKEPKMGETFGGDVRAEDTQSKIATEDKGGIDIHLEEEAMAGAGAGAGAGTGTGTGTEEEETNSTIEILSAYGQPKDEEGLSGDLVCGLSVVHEEASIGSTENESPSESEDADADADADGSLLHIAEYIIGDDFGRFGFLTKEEQELLDTALGSG